MPATGIEPVRYFYRRILSPVRLPIPPRRQEFDPIAMPTRGLEPPTPALQERCSTN